MKVNIEQLDQMFEMYRESMDLRYLKTIITPEHRFLPNDIILRNHLNILDKNNINNVDVVYTYNIFSRLSEEFPDEFRQPYSHLSYIEIDRMLEELDTINLNSMRKRHLLVVGDVYGMDSEGKRTVIIEHGESIDYAKWNGIKRHIDRRTSFFVRNSEVQIMIYVDLSEQADGHYIDRFKMNTDLISVMVSKKSRIIDEIAPDFIPTEDVVSVTDPEKLLDEYKSTEARLIIIGEKLNDSYKRALMKVKRYDKYVRMIVVPALDPRNLDHFFMQVKLVYNSNRWSV